jgi:chemotaxis protein MotB
MAKSDQTIIVRRVKKAAHAHHGGAWKIAYADFVTAMMAFFLLMWLITMTTQEQKIGLAEYFAPESLSPTRSGAGGLLMGTAIDESGSKSARARPGTAQRSPTASADPAAGAAGQQDGAQGTAAEREASRQTAANHSAAASIRQALQSKPEIAELSSNVVIEVTKDGVNVSIVDQDGRAMFPEGSVHPYERTRILLEALAPTLRRLNSRLSVTGHTTAARPGTMPAVDSWSITAGRALAVRDILSASGLAHDRFASVAGRADTEPVFPDNPYLAANRRVTITLLNEMPALPRNFLR